MTSNSTNTASAYDDQEPNAAKKTPADGARTDVTEVLNPPQSEESAEMLQNDKICISGYEYDGYTIQYYSQSRKAISIADHRNRRGMAVMSFDIPIDHLAAGMKAKRESMMQPLEKGQPVLAMTSDGKLREGWKYRPHPIDSNAVVLEGEKEGQRAYTTYSHELLLQQEIAMVEVVAEYTKSDFEMLSTSSGDLEGGWRVTNIIDPETKKLRVFNEGTGQEKLFDSVDHFLIEVNAADREVRLKAAIAEASEKNKIEAKRRKIADKVPHHVAYTVQVGFGADTSERAKLDKYKGRTKITSTSEYIDGQVYMPKSLEEIQEAIVVDTGIKPDGTYEDPVLVSYIDEMFQHLAPKWHRSNLTPEHVLKKMAKKIQSDFPYSHRMRNKDGYAIGKYKPGKECYLGEFMKKGRDSDMVCRHMGLLAAIIIEKIKADPQHSGLLPTDLRSNFMGEQSKSKNNRSGHAYAIVASPSQQGRKYYYLDPANGGRPMQEIGVDLTKHDMDKSEARYLFSLLRTIFNSPDDLTNVPFLKRVFNSEEANPALEKIARNAFYATKDARSKAAVKALRRHMGFSEY